MARAGYLGSPEPLIPNPEKPKNTGLALWRGSSRVAASSSREALRTCAVHGLVALCAFSGLSACTSRWTSHHGLARMLDAHLPHVSGVQGGAAMCRGGPCAHLGCDLHGLLHRPGSHAGYCIASSDTVLLPHVYLCHGLELCTFVRWKKQRSVGTLLRSAPMDASCGCVMGVAHLCTSLPSM